MLSVSLAGEWLLLLMMLGRKEGRKGGFVGWGDALVASSLLGYVGVGGDPGESRVGGLEKMMREGEGVLCILI